MSSKQNINWIIANNPVQYENAISNMNDKVEKILTGCEKECVWLLEHPSIYTAGTSSSNDDLLKNTNIPVFWTGRGGKFTYHGPGQRVMYLMMDLRKRDKDIRLFVKNLEEVIILTLSDFNIQAKRLPGIVGIWVQNKQNEFSKISAIGLRIRKWVTFHGVSINVYPDLSYYSGIIPCGIKEHGVTSIRNEGVNIKMSEFDNKLHNNFFKIFK